MTSVDEKPKNDEKRKASKSDGTGCSGCLSIIAFILELFSFLP
jgi:hypothetical protein